MKHQLLKEYLFVFMRLCVLCKPLQEDPAIAPGCEQPNSAGNQTWVLWKGSKPFYPLRRCSCSSTFSYGFRPPHYRSSIYFLTLDCNFPACNAVTLILLNIWKAQVSGSIKGYMYLKNNQGFQSFKETLFICLLSCCQPFSLSEN